MAVAHQNLPPPLLFFNGRNPHLTFRRPQLCVCSKKTRPLSLSATSQSIFLPYLREQDQESTSPEEQEREPQQEEEVYEEEDGPGEGERERERQDPIRRFFDSRLPTRDPPIEGKFSLQSNRRSSWHISSVVKDEAKDEDLEPDILGNEEETVSLNLDSKPAPDGIPGEILQIVKRLPENSSLGEFLKSFVGKITKKECTQVLELLGQEGLVNCSLYFYDWMRSQEPSLLTPRACSIVFPLLGREGMGDQLVTLFDNLPNKKQFRDVHVYNSALSGLMSSGVCSPGLGYIGYFNLGIQDMVKGKGIPRYLMNYCDQLECLVV